ncbi:MAG TPA: PQQ-binding-like beta-propeller repeat protein [Acidimicrobiia bacterium]|nr:PQQ-binding-like beta-propeller repeat protein [Acidimicrobiia bacterium]
MNERAGQVITIAAAGFILGLAVFLVTRGDPPDAAEGAVVTATTITSTPVTDAPAGTDPLSPTTTVPPTTTTLPPQEREPGTVPGWTVGRPWGSTVGVTMFRGNPTRSFHGSGPVPDSPTVSWRYPDAQMCSPSSDGGETRIWCGMGWTGQPAVWERPDGVTELIFGAYDSAVHFVDAETGEDLRPEFQTGDIIKGSVTLDPDGYPLLYFGSRDNKLRILALDQEEPTLLWSMDASEVNGIWNDDWDSNPAIVDDVMYEGGENGWFFAIHLNRGYNAEGKVTVDPETLVQQPGYNDELLANSGRNVSIESSVVVFEQRVYFSNSGGRIVGMDVSNVANGEAPIVFDYYAGGDIDATMVADEDGMLYVSIEHEPSQMGSSEAARNREVGQLVKLDPYTDGDPRLWGLDLTSGASDAGSWATPALYQGVVYVNTHQGSLIAVDAGDGTLLWDDEVGFHSWSSPVVVDGTLVTATCLGDVRAYSLEDPRSPVMLWSLDLGGSCLESTPVVWKGAIFIGSRDGHMRALR